MQTCKGARRTSIRASIRKKQACSCWACSRCGMLSRSAVQLEDVHNTTQSCVLQVLCEEEQERSAMGVRALDQFLDALLAVTSAQRALNAKEASSAPANSQACADPAFVGMAGRKHGQGKFSVQKLQKPAK